MDATSPGQSMLISSDFSLFLRLCAWGLILMLQSIAA